MDKDNLWNIVGNQCLNKAKELLTKEAIPTAATVETAGNLINIAIMIDDLNLRWEQQSRYGAAGNSGRTLPQTSTKN